MSSKIYAARSQRRHNSVYSLRVSIHIRVLNPNTDAAMTAAVLAAARAVAAPDTVVSAVGAMTGPTSIETHVDEAFGEVAIVRAVAAAATDDVDAFVIACFGDTGHRDDRGGLDERRVAGAPVHGDHVAGSHDRHVRQSGAPLRTRAPMHGSRRRTRSRRAPRRWCSGGRADDRRILARTCRGRRRGDRSRLRRSGRRGRGHRGRLRSPGDRWCRGRGRSLVRQGLRTSPIGTHATVRLP
jgi:hypothetical protein